MIISMSIRILLSLLVLAGKAKGTVNAMGDGGLEESSMLAFAAGTAPEGRVKDHDFTRSNARIWQPGITSAVIFPNRKLRGRGEQK